MLTGIAAVSQVGFFLLLINQMCIAIYFTKCNSAVEKKYPFPYWR